MGQLNAIEQSAITTITQGITRVYKKEKVQGFREYKDIHHSRSSTLISQRGKISLKVIRIRFHLSEKQVYIEDTFLTCGWLLSEAIRLFPEAHPIVGLKTDERIDAIDVWLQDFERSVNIIKDSTLLTPIIGQTIPTEISLAWFEPIAVIGKGGFSNVFLVRKKDTGYLYALKVMQKGFILKEKKVKNANSECEVMKKISHPFINTLRWAFQTVISIQDSELLMVTDFCPGGELFFHLHNIGRFTEDQARFYFTEILLAIEYLHKQKIIFRDLKPENTLIDVDGHIKLIDFGLAKDDTGDRLHSFCGSHEYLSPEMLRKNGYTKSVDFYSLGSFLYEMLTGLPPFFDKDRKKLYDRILNEDLKIPKYLSLEAQSLLRGLLRKDPTLRLGSILGIKEIKDHMWLAKVNWDSISKKKVPPPFRPNSSKPNYETEHLTTTIKDPVFLNTQYFEPTQDDNFYNFFYINDAKTKNHDLTMIYNYDEQYEKSKSFIDQSPVKTKIHYSTPSAKKAINTSLSISPIKCQKIGPELTSVKVTQKFSRKTKPSPTQAPRKHKINLCNKSFVNMRHSLNHSYLGMG